ncbi:MAG: hypothetical protein IGS50_12420 [Synechococcales cyanobacterium C42_A2020_086]|jgi:hypothetical protein|nr:hypothetical protein [Synechococcales cyanobacterium C42_A2020_086]
MKNFTLKQQLNHLSTQYGWSEVLDRLASLADTNDDHDPQNKERFEAMVLRTVRSTISRLLEQATEVAVLICDNAE